MSRPQPIASPGRVQTAGRRQRGVLGVLQKEDGRMGIHIACDWCRQPLKSGDPYVTVEIQGSIVRGHRSNEPEDVGGAGARLLCA